MPKLQDHNGPITRELCETQRLVFFPRDVDESTEIQKKLFAMGYGWANNGRELQKSSYTASSGILLSAGKIYAFTGKFDRTYIVCTLAQFQPNYTPAAVPVASHVDVFNKIAAQLESINVRLATIENRLDEVAPRPIQPLQIKKTPASGQ